MTRETPRVPLFQNHFFPFNAAIPVSQQTGGFYKFAMSDFGIIFEVYRTHLYILRCKISAFFAMKQIIRLFFTHLQHYVMKKQELPSLLLCQRQCLQAFCHLIEDAEEAFHRLSLKHGNACLAKVGNPLEQGTCSQVTAYVQYATVFVYACHALPYLFLEDVHLPVKIHVQPGQFWVQVFLHLTEYPGTTESGTSYHDSIHAIPLKALLGTLGRGDIPIADDGDMHAGIVLHLAYQGPVGLTGVHLGTRPSVYGKSLYATIL